MIHAFIKVGERVYLNDLLNDGVVYMNTLGFFREIEGDIYRKDIHEGSDFIVQVDWIKINFPGGKSIELSKGAAEKTLKGARVRGRNQGFGGNIYSMMSITTDFVLSKQKLSSKNKDLGNSDSFVIINNPVEFIRRLDQELEKNGIVYSHGLVSYYDENIENKRLTVFEKPEIYAHQLEYRLFVEREINEPLVLKVGDLKAIATIHPIEILDQLDFIIENN